MKRWIEITEIIWNKFQENFCHTYNHISYIWRTFCGKKICIIVFSYPLVGLLNAFFTLCWVTASGQKGLKCVKITTDVSEQAKADILGCSNLLKDLRRVSLLQSVMSCAEAQEPEVCVMNQRIATRLHWSDWSLDNWTWSVLFRSLPSWKYVLELRKKTIFIFPRQ